MHPIRYVHFFTFVLLMQTAALIPWSDQALAAPNPPQPNLDEPEKETLGEPSPQDLESTGTINITPPPALTNVSSRGVVSSEYFYRYRNSLSPRAGMVLNSEAYAQDKRFLYIVGFQYLFPTHDLRDFEAGADVVSDGTGRAMFARRWIYSRTRFRPYTKAGGGVKIIPADGLTTFIRLENLQARAAIGAERLLLAPMSLRCEFEVTVGMKGYEALLTAGYSWAW